MTITMAIAKNQLPQVMAEMRSWLDGRGCETSLFTCEPQQDGSIVYSVTFASPADAERFAARFGDNLRPQQR